jgi:hypothetical protein
MRILMIACLLLMGCGGRYYQLTDPATRSVIAQVAMPSNSACKTAMEAAYRAGYGPNTLCSDSPVSLPCQAHVRPSPGSDIHITAINLTICNATLSYIPASYIVSGCE